MSDDSVKEQECQSKCNAASEVPCQMSSQPISTRLLAFLALAVLAIYMGFVVNPERDKRLKPLAAEIQASGRPRVIEFYAEGNAPSQTYQPIIESCRAKYAGRIDFQWLKFDDPKNEEISKMLSVMTVPQTCIFDKNGKQVRSFTGVVSASTLDSCMLELIK